MINKSFKKKMTKNISINKDNFKELKLCDEEELREFKIKLKCDEDISNSRILIQFLSLLKLLNGINPFINYSTYYIKETTKIIVLKTIKKLMKLFTQMDIFFFYFKYYRIDEKIIQKLIPNLKYIFYPKNSIVFKEGEYSTKFYFLLKGKISFKKKIAVLSTPHPQYIEKFSLGDNTHFGEWDIVYERKKKTTAFCVEDCHIIYIDREIFKEYLEQRVNKVESEFKIMIKKTLMKYMRIPETKIDRFIQTDIKTLFFRRGEIIYREGDVNSFLFLINTGEANLVQNFEKGVYTFLQNGQFSINFIKNMAKRIDYKGVIKNAFNGDNNNNININNHVDISDNFDEDENNKNINSFSERLSLIENNINKRNSILKNNSNINVMENLTEIKGENEEDNGKNNMDTLKLDLLLEKEKMKNILSLSKGCIGGLEICTGITKFKYSLISNSDFTSVFKIDLKKIDGEHLTELMINLIPLFIEYERKINYQIKKLKFIDSNLYPESCQKYNKKSRNNFFFKDEENDDKYKKDIIKIDKMFDKNEGGFIKMNNYNMNLQKRKNELKDLIKENSRKDRNAHRYLNLFMNEQSSKLKFRGVKKITPTIPNLEIFDKKFENRDKVGKKEKALEKENEKNSEIYQAVVNNKNYYYLIDNRILSGKKPKTKSFHKELFYTKKAQEMFNKIFTKKDISKLKLNSPVIKLRKKTKNMNYKKIILGNDDYMRDLVIKKNKTNVHCFDTDNFFTKNKKIAKSLKENRSFREYYKTYGNMMDIRKITFFDTGKYDIPLLTENNESKI